MAHDLKLDATRVQQHPLILILTDQADDPTHWSSAWETQCFDCLRVHLGLAGDPHRNKAVNFLNLAIHRTDSPIVLVAEGLACLVVAWWAEFERPPYGNPVVGALLSSPPDLDRPGRDARLTRFGSSPRNALPFPSFLIGKPEDNFGGLRSSRMLAKDWDARFLLADTPNQTGRGNAAVDWPQGKTVLAQLLREHRLAVARGDTAPQPQDLADDDRVMLSASRARGGNIVSVAQQRLAQALP